MFLVAVTALTMVTTLTTLQIILQAYAKTAALDPLPGPLINGTSSLYPTDLDEVPTYAQRLWNSVLSMPLVMLFGTFTLGCTYTLTSLLCFHAMIISDAQTTNERVRNVYQYGRNQNVDDHGCCQNWRDALCSRRPESRLPYDLTEMIMCDHSKPETVWRDTPLTSEQNSQTGNDRTQGNQPTNTVAV